MEQPNPNKESGSPAPQRDTSAFPSVLIAMLALAVIGWVGYRLLQPPPTPPVPAETAQSSAPAPAPTDTGTPALPVELATNTEDPVCGMNPERSAQRVEAEFADGTLLAFDSLACYYEYLETQAETAPVRERIVAYDTYKNDEPALLEFGDAVWLIELERPVPGAMPPGAAAFRTANDAQKARGNLGSDISDAAGMKEYTYNYLKDNGVV